jgi:chromate transporter
VGLIGSSAVIVAQSANHHLLAYAVTAATAVITYFTRLNPVWLFAAAGLLGFAGFI